MSQPISATAPAIFNFQSHQVRIVVIDGAPWFVASDVAAALEYLSAKDMSRILDDDEKGGHIVPTLGGNQEVTIISESGLYHAVLKSRKPKAKPFRRWVTGEVLPAIRKTGRYEQEHRPAIHPPIWTKPRPSCKRYPGQDMSGAPRTIETAREILSDLLAWAHEELPNPARAETVDALQHLSGLLTTGWTEVDEALAAMSRAMRYLHRWQDRGGRIGNAG
jgi:hypothetical protein